MLAALRVSGELLAVLAEASCFQGEGTAAEGEGSSREELHCERDWRATRLLCYFGERGEGGIEL